MLNPSMQELMKKVGNRYLLVNLAAQRARDIAQEAEETEERLKEKLNTVPARSRRKKPLTWNSLPESLSARTAPAA